MPLKDNINNRRAHISRNLLDRAAQQTLQRHARQIAKDIHEEHRRLDERAFYPALIL